MVTVTQIGPRLGIAPTCAALGLARATYYRRRRPPRVAPPRRPSPRALGDAERTAVLEQLHTPRFVDLAPGEVYATLLDEGTYLCSERTMYRLLAQHAEVRERRDQLRHPRYAAPELLAQRPNELWSWDITKLLGPAKWTYFYLYVEDRPARPHAPTGSRRVYAIRRLVGATMPDDNPVVVTGSGGLHHYFGLDSPLPKSAPFAGLDVQADGALVVAPPSVPCLRPVVSVGPPTRVPLACGAGVVAVGRHGVSATPWPAGGPASRCPPR
jgi:hypothetical protein